ncbi:MAG: helix-turn-helix transcriptional regulator [Oscillospiraceae bacterium]|nr:helix-turn-helix transcriptional regulator [Oscillospiraceae bacterium]
MKNTQIVAERIKLQSKEKGFSVKKLLESCELGVNTVTKMANGTDIVSQNLLKIADHLECSVDYLLGRTEEPKLETGTEIKQNNNNGINHGINAFMVTAPSEKQLDENHTELLRRFAMLGYAEKIEFMQKLIEKTEKREVS